jgi:hypothetical protein
LPDFEKYDKKPSQHCCQILENFPINLLNTLARIWKICQSTFSTLLLDFGKFAIQPSQHPCQILENLC